MLGCFCAQSVLSISIFGWLFPCCVSHVLYIQHPCSQTGFWDSDRHHVIIDICFTFQNPFWNLLFCLCNPECWVFFCLLRCSVCCDHLTNWYYEKDGKLYCRNHYWEKFGELCHGCSLLMTGPAMVSLLLSCFYSIVWRVFCFCLLFSFFKLSLKDTGIWANT